MAQLKLAGRVTCYSFTAVAIIAALFIAASGYRSIAGPQQDESVASVNSIEIELAELRVSLLSQQIVVAKIEGELLEPARQAAEQKVAAAAANLAAATIEADNARQLFEKNVVSEREKQLHAAKRDAVAAALEIAKAESESARKSIKLKEANITLLKLREKIARTELQQLSKKAP